MRFIVAILMLTTAAAASELPPQFGLLLDGAAAGGAAGWTNTAGLALFIDGLTGTWTDLSPDSRTISQTNAASQPTILDDGIWADGTNDFLNIEGGLPLSSNMQVVMVYERPTAGKYSPVLATTGASYPYSIFWYSDNVTYSAEGQSFVTAAAANTSTGWFVLSSWRTNATAYFARNGVVISTNTAPTFGTATNFNCLFRRSGNYSFGKLAGVWVFTNVVRDPETALAVANAASNHVFNGGSP